MVCLVLAAAAGCGGRQSKASTEELLARLPPEGKAVIYESENDLVIALNRRDTARLGVEEVEHDLGGLAGRWRHIQARLKQDGHGDHVSKARRMMAARARYLKAHLQVARFGVEMANANISLARAKLRRARWGELVRFGMAPGSRLGGLDSDVASADKAVRAVERRELSVCERERKAFELWKQTEDEYAEQTGDHDTGIWID